MRAAVAWVTSGAEVGRGVGTGCDRLMTVGVGKMTQRFRTCTLSVMWDLFVAAGFSVGVFYLFAAVLAWQLGGLAAKTLAGLGVTRSALALCFAATTVVRLRHPLLAPSLFSLV